MITIIQNQYETAKELLALCEFNLKCVQAFNAQKDFDIYYNNVSSLLTVTGLAMEPGLLINRVPPLIVVAPE